MKENLKLAGWAALVLVVIIGFTYGYLVWFKDYAPRMENAKRGVFEQTQSYVHGKATYIGRLCLEYETADEGHKAVLRATILNEATTVEREDLPSNVRRCLEKLE